MLSLATIGTTFSYTFDVSAIINNNVSFTARIVGSEIIVTLLQLTLTGFLLRKKRKTKFNDSYYAAKASLITELANQRARKALFTCVVYNVMYTPRRRWKGFSELTTTTKPVGILNLKLFYILMQI